MATDYAGALPIRTERDDEVKIKLVDFEGADPATAGLKIEADGSVNTNTKITDGTDTLAVNTDGSVNTQITDGTDTLAVNTDGSINTVSQISDGTGTLAINTGGSINAQVTDGTDVLAINSDGTVNVVSVDGGSKVCVYGEHLALAQNTSGTTDYVVTDTKTFVGKSLLVGGLGAAKIVFGTWNGTALTVKGTYFQQPGDNKSIDLPSLELLGDATAAIRVVVTNKDKAASDLHITLQGNEY
jgi:hypothetical protein